MKQNFAISLVIGSLFALWLFNTGRVAAFKSFIINTPSQPTLPTAKQTSGSGGVYGGGQDSKKIAQCAAEADSGAVSTQCLLIFESAINHPLAAIAGVVSTLSFGLIHL